ncbi:DUF1592 domain-containing protein [Polyangium aurulentum]|uniref:DUF1592 domain-containing protein n=1 Tax=Polyangium aurulentum TaxID=2567896 RepID=UPI0010AE4119|nr:DUF1592 domain-containing protein [Polyangium aurulentum]UQA55525.1 DUF1592 domain-containing protein [Polyangium aurulentum]
MKRFLRTAWLAGPLLAAACTGNLGDLPSEPTTGEAESPVCTGGIEPGKSPIRRMTRLEYNNTVHDLLGDDTKPASGFVPEEEALGFNNQASALVVSPLLAEQYMQAAEDLAAVAAPGLLAKIPSCTNDTASSACTGEVAKVVEDLGKRAFRRPVASDEVTEYVDLFTTGTGLGASPKDPSVGIQLVVQAMLQAPHFLYRVELGTSESVEGDVVSLSSWEMASRLSYLFWNTMPDPDLFAAAEADELTDPAQIEAQARRLLADPRARAGVTNFHDQWLGLGKIEDVASSGKDPVLYPDYSDALLPLMREETERFFDHAIFEEDADVTSLFTAPWSMMNKPLADFYGVTGPKGDAFERVELDPEKHAGFITQAGLLTLYAKPNRTSPVHRGKWVRQSLLCQIPPPPPDAVPPAPDVDPTKTTREQFSEHTSNELCRNCHRMLDPIGFGLENYDALGRYRDKENGKPVDASGEVLETRDANGPFNGAIELAERLGGSDQVRDCVSRQWFRYGYGRAEQKTDDCSMAQIEEAFEKSGNDIKELLVALTQTHAFRYRHAPVPGGEY